MKKLLATLLSFLMIATALSGCSDKPDAQTSSKDSSPVSDAKPEVKQEISFYSYWCGELDDGSYVEKLIEDAVGIEIKVRKVDNNNPDQVNMMLASDDMPDCGWFDKYPAEMYKQELVRNIPRDMVKQYAPSFIKEYDKNPILYAQSLAQKDENQFQFLPGIADDMTQFFFNNDYYRYDWIENAGIDLGVNVEKISDNIYIADDAISLDKFREIMTAFVKNDPDKSGKADTIGASIDGVKKPALFSGFDFIWGKNNVDGKAQEWFATPGFKDYLKFMQQLYKDGLVDKEVMTQDRNACWEKVNSGMAGYWITSTNALSSWAIGRPPLSLIEKDPTVKILMTPGLKSKTGKAMQGTAATPMYGQFYVNAKVTDDAKLAKILEFTEYANFGETLPSHVFGEEGIDWEMKDGTPVKTNPLMNGVKGTWSFCQFMQVGDVMKWLNFEPLFAAGSKYYVESEGGIWNKNLVQDYKMDINNVTDVAAVAAEYQPDIDIIIESYIMDCVLGKKDVDATWDKYIAEINAKGYDKIMAEIEKVEPLADIISKYSK